MQILPVHLSGRPSQLGPTNTTTTSDYQPTIRNSSYDDR